MPRKFKRYIKPYGSLYGVFLKIVMQDKTYKGGYKMRNGVYYLNNSGTKAVFLINGKQEKVLLFHGLKGYCKMRTPVYQYAFGNFSGYAFKYEGKLIKVFPEVINGKVVCFVDYKEKC